MSHVSTDGGFGESQSASFARCPVKGVRELGSDGSIVGNWAVAR